MTQMRPRKTRLSIRAKIQQTTSTSPQIRAIKHARSSFIVIADHK